MLNQQSVILTAGRKPSGFLEAQGLQSNSALGSLMTEGAIRGVNLPGTADLPSTLAR
jgi:hypothetical protein